jgi:hypothetical protein
MKPWQRWYIIRALFKGAAPAIGWLIVGSFVLALSVEFVADVFADSSTFAVIREAEFRRSWNKFADAANKLMEGEKAGVWDVKQAREVERLFDGVKQDPNWRTR